MATRLPGDRMGAYRLERKLGAGAFAEVWCALEEGPEDFEKHVALKILGEASESSLDAQRSLVNEARLGARLRHPNLVDVYRIAEIDGAWTIVMELVDGPDLRQLLSRVDKLGLRLPRSVILDIGIGLAEGLAYAHSARGRDGHPLRLVHRDLKPANVLLTVHGAVKIADFGLAKAVSDGGATTTHVVKGTPLYIAPEVWAGESGDDPRTDLYALGAVLFEMAVGYRLVREGPTASVAMQALFGKLDLSMEPLAEVFPELVPVVRGLLEPRREARTRRAEDVARTLRALRANDEGESLSSYLRTLHVAGTRPGLRAARRAQLELPTPVDPAWAGVTALARDDEATMSTLDLRLRDERPQLKEQLGGTLPEIGHDWLVAGEGWGDAETRLPPDRSPPTRPQQRAVELPPARDDVDASRAPWPAAAAHIRTGEERPVTANPERVADTLPDGSAVTAPTTTLEQDLPGEPTLPPRRSAAAPRSLAGQPVRGARHPLDTASRPARDAAPPTHARPPTAAKRRRSGTGSPPRRPPPPRRSKPKGGTSGPLLVTVLLVLATGGAALLEGLRVGSDRAALLTVLDEGYTADGLTASLPGLLDRAIDARQMRPRIASQVTRIEGATDRFFVEVVVQEELLGIPWTWKVRKAGTFDVRGKAADLRYWRQSGWRLDPGADLLERDATYEAAQKR